MDADLAMHLGRRMPAGTAPPARRVFVRALRTLKVTPSEVITDTAPIYPAVLDELVPAAWHHVEQSDRGRSQPAQAPTATDARTQADRTAQMVIAGHALIPNLRR